MCPARALTEKCQQGNIAGWPRAVSGTYRELHAHAAAPQACARAAPIHLVPGRSSLMQVLRSVLHKKERGT